MEKGETAQPAKLSIFSPLSWGLSFKKPFCQETVLTRSTSFPGFSPTRPRVPLSRSPGRVGEDPENEVAYKMFYEALEGACIVKKYTQDVTSYGSEGL